MKKIVCGLLFVVYGFVCVGQTYSHCKVYQFAGTDSSEMFVAKTINYTIGNKKILSEEYTGYKENADQGWTDGTYSYFYKDTLLKRRMFGDTNKDSTKALYKYDKKGKLTIEEHWSKEHKKSWQLVSMVQHRYDSAGNEVEYYASEMHWDNQNRYTWKYDSAGKVLEYSSYNHKKLLWTQSYWYSDTSYCFTRVWYNLDGTKKDGFRLTYNYKLDDKGRVTEVTLLNENLILVEKTTTAYNKEGQVARTVCYNLKGIPVITHIYIYAHE